RDSGPSPSVGPDLSGCPIWQADWRYRDPGSARPMTRSSILTAWSLLLLSGLPPAASCGASDSNASNDGASSRCDGGDCPAYDASLESGVVHPTHEGGLDAEAAPPRNPLCGSGCLPDDALACSEFSPPTSKHRELLPDASPEEPDTDDMGGDLDAGAEIGRASCRDRGAFCVVGGAVYAE